MRGNLQPLFNSTYSILLLEKGQLCQDVLTLRFSSERFGIRLLGLLFVGLVSFVSHMGWSNLCR